MPLYLPPAVNGIRLAVTNWRYNPSHLRREKGLGWRAVCLASSGGIMRAVVCLLASLMMFSVSLVGVTWEDCASELDRLRRAARDASSAAEDAATAREEYVSCQQNRDPNDDCDSQRSSYESAVSMAESELDTIARRIRSVVASCELPVPSAATGSESGSLCNLYQSYRGKVPLETLLESCRKRLPESECRRCLGQQ